MCVYAGGIPNQALSRTGFRMGVTQPENASLSLFFFSFPPAKGPKVLHHLLIGAQHLRKIEIIEMFFFLSFLNVSFSRTLGIKTIPDEI